MRWLILGGRGQLGHALAEALPAIDPGSAVLAASRAVADVRDRDQVAAVLERFKPDVVINAAAWTAVDAAETAPQAAAEVNAVGTATVAEAVADAAGDACLVHVSTDYVFGRPGPDRAAWREDDPSGPLSVYGRTKREGEIAVLETLPDRGYVVRTAWLYGTRGVNFVDTMMSAARQSRPVRVVDDQWGQPTWTRDLAAAMIELGRRSRSHDVAPGVYHATNAGRTTWCGLAREVYRLCGIDPELVTPVTSSEFPRPAPRPAWSVLDHEKWTRAGLTPLRSWDEALAEAVPALINRS